MSHDRHALTSRFKEVSAADVERAAWAWRNDKDRETDSSDTAYFRQNWHALPGLRAYVEREVDLRELRDVLGAALNPQGQDNE